MSKLKTLKDMRRRDVMVSGCPDETDYDIVEADDLRQEAIKWIKAPCPKRISDCKYCQGADRNLINFFNITEEELE